MTAIQSNKGPCCRGCLSSGGCYPWKISKKETALHLFFGSMGIGILTALVGSHLRNRKIEEMTEWTTGLDVSYSPRSVKPSVSIDSDAGPGGSYIELEEMQMGQKELLVAQRDNCRALSLINVALTVTSLFILHMTQVI